MKSSQVPALVASALILFCSAAPAFAHIQLREPAQRETAQKTGPCGSADSVRGVESTFRPGETIVVRWEETINHPSHYRISFDVDGTDDFADPPTMMDFYSNDAVLLDEIVDEEQASQEVEITLPNVTCDNCTLQLVQVMYDKPPYEVGGNDLYYQCADIILAGEPVDMGTQPMPDTGTVEMDMDMATPDMNPGPSCGPDEFYNAVTDRCESYSQSDMGTTADIGDAPPEDGLRDGSDDDSACSAVGSGASWLALLVLAFFRRRR